MTEYDDYDGEFQDVVEKLLINGSKRGYTIRVVNERAILVYIKKFNNGLNTTNLGSFDVEDVDVLDEENEFEVCCYLTRNVDKTTKTTLPDGIEDPNGVKLE